MKVDSDHAAFEMGIRARFTLFGREFSLPFPRMQLRRGETIVREGLHELSLIRLDRYPMQPRLQQSNTGGSIDVAVPGSAGRIEFQSRIGRPFDFESDVLPGLDSKGRVEEVGTTITLSGRAGNVIHVRPQPGKITKVHLEI